MDNSGSSIFALPEYKNYLPLYSRRQQMYNRYRRYYDGTIYGDSAYKLAHKLYAQTKAILSFLGRAVDLDAAFIPSFNAPWQLKPGTPSRITDAQTQLYEWSSWDTAGDEWLEDGATNGEAMIKIVPDDSGPSAVIRMQRIKPEICMLVKHVDPRDQSRYDMAIIVDRSSVGADGKPYEYGEVITPAQIRTYYNGAPYGYEGNPDTYDNPLQFVPIVRAKNDGECRPSFAKCLPQLDSVNELASYLGDIIGRHAEPQWAAFGAAKSDLVKSGDNLWFFPSGSDIKAILAEVDVAGTLAFLQEIKQETKANLPELAFDDLRAKDQIATETLAIQLVELDAKIWKMRRRYDAALADAHLMASMAANVYGVMDLAPLLAPHQFNWERPIRPVSEEETIRLKQQRLSLLMMERTAGGEGLTSLVAPAAADADLNPDLADSELMQ
jgi:hypothetical protein